MPWYASRPEDPSPLKANRNVAVEWNVHFEITQVDLSSDLKAWDPEGPAM